MMVTEQTQHSLKAIGDVLAKNMKLIENLMSNVLRDIFYTYYIYIYTKAKGKR